MKKSLVLAVILVLALVYILVPVVSAEPSRACSLADIVPGADLSNCFWTETVLTGDATGAYIRNAHFEGKTLGVAGGFPTPPAVPLILVNADGVPVTDGTTIFVEGSCPGSLPFFFLPFLSLTECPWVPAAISLGSMQAAATTSLWPGVLFALLALGTTVVWVLRRRQVSTV